MTKRTEEFAFLPPAPQSTRTRRFVVMATEEEAEAIQAAAMRLGMDAKDVIKYAFEHLVLPGILRDMERLKLTKSSKNSPDDRRGTDSVDRDVVRPSVDEVGGPSVGDDRTTNVAG